MILRLLKRPATLIQRTKRVKLHMYFKLYSYFTDIFYVRKDTYDTRYENDTLNCNLKVRCADSDRPQYVRLYGQKNYRRVLQNFTRRWALMISNDTQSSSEDSISQSY